MKNQFGGSVIAVSTVHKSAAGQLTSETLFTRKSDRKKSRRHLRGADKFVRRLVRATAEGAVELANRHENSSRKKRSGGLRDLGKNMMKATRKVSKRLKLFEF